jgi:hypothetical protein
MVYIFNMHRRKYKALYSRFNSANNVGLSVIKHKTLAWCIGLGCIEVNPVHSTVVPCRKSTLQYCMMLASPLPLLFLKPPPWSHPLNPKQICAQFWIHIDLIWIRIQHKTLMWIRILDPDHVKIDACLLEIFEFN